MEITPGKTLIMGILNVTPDSFSDGGRFISADSAVRQAEKMAEEGADIIDIGGESSRPGATEISAEEEQKRILPVIKAIAGRLPVKISVDTSKPQTAEKCLECGTEMINDITGLGNSAMREIVSRYKSDVVIMHMKGSPRTMQENPEYRDVVGDIGAFFRDRIKMAEDGGIERSKIVLDPGIGFGKTLAHNLEIIKRLKEFTAFGLPVMLGVSRKSFIGKITGLPVDERLEGTIAAAVIAIANGVNILRVHDVKEAKRAAMVADAIVNS